jgi:glyoxylase-like metal-dependent hydrolase (beta-lactamase superfamily II)
MHLQFGSVSIHLGHKSGQYPDGNQLIVRGSDTAVAFDTPLSARALINELQAIDMVILGHVHEDHMAALDLLMHVPVLVHRLDIEAARSWDGLSKHYGYQGEALAGVRSMIERDFHYQPRPDAKAYIEGQNWQLGAGVSIRAHHLPGHTSGHCALVIENEGVAFIGDIELSSFGPYYGDATSSLADFRKSLKQVADIEAKIWVTSHHRAVITDRQKFLSDLAKFADKIDLRSENLLHRLRLGGGQTIDQIAKQGFLYPANHAVPWAYSAECRTISQHLDELMAQQLVGQQAGIYFALP